MTNILTEVILNPEDFDELCKLNYSKPLSSERPMLFGVVIVKSDALPRGMKGLVYVDGNGKKTVALT